tara:strand:- start:576 stop:752 length:177 start_codon:yes stop_codon:yes gene_type:complete
MVNKIIKYNRKRNHINYVQNYVDNLYADIFRAALSGNIILNNNKLFKKYSKYLELLKF